MEPVEKIWTGLGKNNLWYEIEPNSISNNEALLKWNRDGSLIKKIGELYYMDKVFYFVYENPNIAFLGATQFTYANNVNLYTADPVLRPHVSDGTLVLVLEPEKPFIVCDTKTIRSRPVNFPLSFSYEVIFLLKILSENATGWIAIDGHTNYRHLRPLVNKD